MNKKAVAHQTDAAPSASVISSPNGRGHDTPSPAGFLTPEDVCGMLCISHFTLQKMVQRRAIPHLKIGHRTVRFDKKEIKAWIEKKRVSVNPFTLVRVRRAG